jgi:hypothetical protein
VPELPPQGMGVTEEQRCLPSAAFVVENSQLQSQLHEPQQQLEERVNNVRLQSHSPHNGLAHIYMSQSHAIPFSLSS